MWCDRLTSDSYPWSTRRGGGGGCRRRRRRARKGGGRSRRTSLCWWRDSRWDRRARAPTWSFQCDAATALNWRKSIDADRNGNSRDTRDCIRDRARRGGRAAINWSETCESLWFRCGAGRRGKCARSSPLLLQPLLQFLAARLYDDDDDEEE